MTIKVFGELPGPNSKKPYVSGNVLALSSSLLTPTTAEPLPRHGVEGKFGSRIQLARRHACSNLCFAGETAGSQWSLQTTMCC